MAQTNDKSALASFEPEAGLSPEEIDSKCHVLLGELTLDEKLGMMDADTLSGPGSLR